MQACVGQARARGGPPGQGQNQGEDIVTEGEGWREVGGLKELRYRD